MVEALHDQGLRPIHESIKEWLITAWEILCHQGFKESLLHIKSMLLKEKGLCTGEE